MVEQSPPEGPDIGPTAFHRAVSSSDPAERAAAIARAQYEPEVEEAVIKALADPDPGVRMAAVRALARWGGRSATKALMESGAADPSPEVRAVAVEALGRILEGWPNGA
jgi:HEAT repeat protein